MGSCLTIQSDKFRGEQLEESLLKHQHVNKLLLLGSGGSGKTTIFKQFRAIYGKGFSQENRMYLKHDIHYNIIFCMKFTLEIHTGLQVHNLCIGLSSTEVRKAATMIREIKEDERLTIRIANAIKILWAEPVIKEIYHQSWHSGAYFWDKIDGIMTKEYCPSNEDILSVYKPTSGIIEQTFTIKEEVFHIFDVCRNQNDRKIWIDCSEDATAIIFTASLSCYDKVCFYDDSVNCMVNQLELFNQICNNWYWINTEIILVFTHKDVLKQKIERIPLDVCAALRCKNRKLLDEMVKRFQNFTNVAIVIRDIVLDGYIAKNLHVDIAIDIRNIISHFCGLDMFYDHLYMNEMYGEQWSRNSMDDAQANIDGVWNDSNFTRFYIAFKFKSLNKNKNKLPIHFVNCLDEQNIVCLFDSIYEHVVQS